MTTTYNVPEEDNIGQDTQVADEKLPTKLYYLIAKTKPLDNQTSDRSKVSLTKFYCYTTTDDKPEVNKQQSAKHDQTTL